MADHLAHRRVVDLRVAAKRALDTGRKEWSETLRLVADLAEAAVELHPTPPADPYMRVGVFMARCERLRDAAQNFGTDLLAGLTPEARRA